MQGNRRKLLSLIEERPRTVHELADATGMRIGTIWEALREFKALGIVDAKRLRAPGGVDGAPQSYTVYQALS
jgi:predicted transcriptional regulator